MAWLIGSMLAAGAATIAVLLSRVERVRIQAEPDPTTVEPTPQRRHGDRSAA